MHPILGSEKGR